MMEAGMLLLLALLARGPTAAAALATAVAEPVARRVVRGMVVAPTGAVAPLLWCLTQTEEC